MNGKCRYGCGKWIDWTWSNGKYPPLEMDNTPHTYERCADLLIEQGENPTELFAKFKKRTKLY